MAGQIRYRQGVSISKSPPAIDDTPCQAFSENMKVQVAEEAVLYPDVFVTCDREFSADQSVFTTPVLVIEVLSPSTQAYDRSKKFAMYRQLASLREYALIDPDSRVRPPARLTLSTPF